jgi:transcriptional regulator GlxA family with amidase domain
VQRSRPREQLASSAYQEHTPAAPLRASVECYWTRRSSGVSQRVLPDGCVDILLRRPLFPDGAPRGDWHAHVVGTMTRAIVTDTAAEEFLGVRFRPGEAFRFLRFPAAEGTDLNLDLEAIWGSFARELAEDLEAARGLAAQLAMLDRALLRRQEGAAPADFRVRRAVEALRRGSTSVAGLARDAGLSPRQLQRLFDERVGVGPKALARIFRLQRGVALLSAGPVEPWAHLALQAGYADQAHLIREFQALAGVSPTNFVRAHAMSDSFNPEHLDLGT